MCGLVTIAASVVEQTLKAALLASAATWGAALPVPSARDDWEPGYVYHEDYLYSGGDAWAFLPQHSTWLRMKTFGVRSPLTRCEDLQDVRQKRAFVDVIGLASSCLGFGWYNNREFWQNAFDLCVVNADSSQNGSSELHVRLEHQRCLNDLDGYDLNPCFIIDFECLGCDLHKLEWCFSFLTASTSAILDPALPLSEYAIYRPLEVVMMQGKWICMIVPGFGFGWINNTAIVSEDVRNVIPRPPIPLRSFVWVAHEIYSESDIPAVGNVDSLDRPGP